MSLLKVKPQGAGGSVHLSHKRTVSVSTQAIGSQAPQPSSWQAAKVSLEPLAATRRQALLAALSAVVVSAGVAFAPQDALAGQVAAVGTYLPPSGIEDFVLFVPDKARTPSLRAGTVDPSQPYRFNIPPKWSEQRVNNVKSGNYCQPRCDEPWTEALFANDGEGAMELIISPLKKLTPRKDVSVEELGSPMQVLERIGNFITGTYLDEEEVISATSKVVDGRTYYYYEINASYGKVGPHTLTAVTTKGEVAYLFIISATDKQWKGHESSLRTLVETFRG